MNRIICYQDRFIPLCMLVGVGGYNEDDGFVKKMLKTPDFWKIRPLTEEMIYYAASNALCLVPRGYTRLEGYVLTKFTCSFGKKIGTSHL